MRQICQWGAVMSLILLISVCLAWEIWLYPIRPGGSWLALKAVMAVFPLRGLLHGDRYTFQWSSMFILLYFFEGVMRAWSELLPIRGVALIEIGLSLLFFICVVTYAKQSIRLLLK